MKTLMVLSVTLIAACLLAGGCARPPEPGSAGAGEAQLRIVGSTTLLPLAQKWSEAFRSSNPEVNIAVSGGGSGNGIEALSNGSAEVATSSRSIKPKEIEAARAKGVNPVEHLVAYDGLAVIVHPDSPLTHLTVQQLSDIYTGRVTEWSQLGAEKLGDIMVINRDSSSGTYESFKELVVQLDGKAKERDYAPGTINQVSNEAIASLVAQGRGTIGYIGLGYLRPTVKPLSIIGLEGGDPVEATEANVVSGKYPIARELYLYTDGQPAGLLAQFISWIKSAAGQEIVSQNGFVAISTSTQPQ